MGFRHSSGGYQKYADILPDLTVVGKIVRPGGMPGVVAGEPHHDRYERVQHFGTFNASPPSATVGVATLKKARTGEPQRCSDSRPLLTCAIVIKPDRSWNLQRDAKRIWRVIMKKLAIGLVSLVLIAAAIAGVSIRVAQVQESHGSDDAGPHPTHRVFASLVEDGTLTAAQAHAAMERLSPVLREVIERHVHHQLAEIRERHEVQARHHLAELHEDLHREQEQARRIHEAQSNNLLSLLEIGAPELRELLEQGQTIAAVGEARGVKVEEIVAVMARPIQRKVDSLVKTRFEEVPAL